MLLSSYSQKDSIPIKSFPGSNFHQYSHLHAAMRIFRLPQRKAVCCGQILLLLFRHVAPIARLCSNYFPPFCIIYTAPRAIFFHEPQDWWDGVVMKEFSDGECREKKKNLGRTRRSSKKRNKKKNSSVCDDGALRVPGMRRCTLRCRWRGEWQ